MTWSIVAHDPATGAFTPFIFLRAQNGLPVLTEPKSEAVRASVLTLLAKPLADKGDAKSEQKVS